MHAGRHWNSGAENRNAGFTLIELLVVIAIICILVGLLVPATRTILEQSARAKAATQTIAVANAIRSFQAANGRWPGQSGYAANTVPVDGQAQSGAILAELTNNLRGTFFLETKESWFDGSGQMIDPWKRPLSMAMDESTDGQVGATLNCPGSPGASLVTNVANETVLVMSWGPDPARADKRVLSWQR